MHPEAGPQYNPELEGSQEERPKWVIQTRSRFTEQSLGFVLFPPELEGRSRPEPVLNKDLDESVLFLKSPQSRVLKRLVDNNIKTLDNILSLPEGHISSFAKDTQRKIKEGLQHHLKGLVILPHARLIEALYRQPQYPVPIEREQELVDVVEEKVNGLKLKRDREFLIYRFGLYDGIYKSYREINKKYNLSNAAINGAQIRALTYVHDLRGYRSLPEVSFGRHDFGAVFYKELHNLRGHSIDFSDLSEFAKQELPRVYSRFKYATINPSFYIVRIEDIWDADLQKAGISQETQEEILKKVKDYYNLHFTKRVI